MTLRGGKVESPRAHCPEGFYASGGGFFVPDAGLFTSPDDAVSTFRNHQSYGTDWGSSFRNLRDEEEYAATVSVCLGED